jgi:hypothetical protein
MKKRLLLLAILAVSIAASADEPQTLDAQRARIGTERGQAEAEYQASEKACYALFAVNDCLNEAKAMRRARLADLRRQEIQLNDAERRRKAAERVRLSDESQAVDRQDEALRRARAASAQQGRETRAAEKAADRAAAEASRPAQPPERQHQAPRNKAQSAKAPHPPHQDAPDAVKLQEQLVAEAEERKAALEKRLADRKKPAARPLPEAP